MASTTYNSYTPTLQSNKFYRVIHRSRSIRERFMRKSFIIVGPVSLKVIWLKKISKIILNSHSYLELWLLPLTWQNVH